VRGFGTERASPIATITTRDLAAMQLPDGSIGPKADACVRFTEQTGRESAIGSLTDAAAVLSGAAGTTVTLREHAVPEVAHGA
jgi:carbamate kinase